MQPREIDRDASGRLLSIVWQDGSTSLYEAAALRAACGCSACGSATSFPTRSLVMMTEEARTIREVHLIDSRRIRIVWEDGHDQSWYTFASLRAMTPPSTSNSTIEPPSATDTTS
jgi:DUF971 family protein